MDAFAGENRVYQFGDFELEAGRRVLRSRVSGSAVPLTSRAFDLLLLLVKSPNTLVTKEALMAALWPDLVVEDNNLDQAIFVLRQSLGERRGQHHYIKTIHRRGYQFTAPVSLVSAQVVSSTESTAQLEAPQSVPRTRLAIAAASAFALLIAIAMVVRFPGSSPARPAASPGAQPLAVRALSAPDNEEGRLLGETMTTILEQRFAAIRGLPVIAPESIWAARDSRDADVAFGRKLQARYVMSGTVGRSNQRLQLSLALTDTKSGETIWSRAFDQPLADLTALREEIVSSAIAAVHVAPMVNDEAVKAPIDLDVCELYMRALRLMGANVTLADTEKAAVLFSRTTVLDPRFARGYLGIADALMYTHDMQPHLTTVPKSAITGEARAAVERALVLNPALGEAWIALARLTADPAQAEQMYRHGLQLKPNYTVGSMFFYGFLMGQDRAGEAIDVIDRARQLDPLSATLLTFESTALMASRSDVAGSERLLRQALTLPGGADVAAFSLAESLRLNHGEFAEGLRLMQQLHPNSGVRATMAFMYLDMDDLPDAMDVWYGADPRPNFPLMVISQYRHDTHSAAQVARAQIAAARWDLYGFAAESLRDEALTNGDYVDALRVLEPLYAAHPWEGTFATADHQAAIVFAHTLLLAGEAERGRKLAKSLLVSLDGDEIGRPQHWFARERAQLFAILGEDDRAVAELSADQGMHHWSRWWYTGEIDPIFARLRGDPRFQKLADTARRQRVAQRALLDEMRRKGEIPTTRRTPAASPHPAARAS